jgi:hypothetical protein
MNIDIFTGFKELSTRLYRLQILTGDNRDKLEDITILRYSLEIPPDHT